MLPFWILYLIAPVNPFIKEDNIEVSDKSEKKFYKDKRFFIPLYSIIFTNTLVWIWSLVVVSEKINIDHWLFTKVNPTGSG